MTAAAFQATYSDWRIIKGRKVVQLVFELPLEKADEAYQVLGGMPIAAKEIWCAVARLQGATTEEVKNEPPQERSPSPVAPAAEKTRRSFDEMPPAQQAGMLCNEPAFQKFLSEKHAGQWSGALQSSLHFGSHFSSAELASETICRLVNVARKRDIDAKNSKWTSLVLAYRLWQREAEVVPA